MFRDVEITWAADRTGLYFTTTSTRLGVGEAEYIFGDSGAKALFASSNIGPLTDELAIRVPDTPLNMAGTPRARFLNWCQAQTRFPVTPIEDESPGGWMLYSSGTTGP